MTLTREELRFWEAAYCAVLSKNCSAYEQSARAQANHAVRERRSHTINDPIKTAGPYRSGP